MAQAAPSSQPPVHPHEAQLKNPDGSWKYTNALTHETSPYLLQHAHNPVDWYPWGPQAFDLARRTGKPIFLSIGYSTCYWCHVMERQVFEDPVLAGLMNQHCVNIKVDREERPDVDDIYMAAVQLMTGHGGWPMSVFLTPPGADGEDDPGLKPFWAGTYIPPEPRHGLPGFAQLIDGITNTWKTQRQDVLDQADRVAQAIQQHLGQQDPPVPLTPQLVQAAANQLTRQYDPTHGGFGQAPKFPQPANLQFLIKVHQNNPNPQLRTALAYTLERMARGGVYDQVGGGFHRYATDEKWLVPHFEKMLYDNAQLVEAYLDAHATIPDAADPKLYERVVRETCDYVLREMTDSTGAFWSAQDAEVDAREGGNYLWTPQEIKQAIGDPKRGDLANRLYGLDRGTNFQDPHHRDQPPTNVLYLPMRLDLLAKQDKVTTEQLTAARQQINQQLLAVRDKRKQPATDDKVLVSWNGLMIAAMAQAGETLNEPRYTQAAANAANAILTHMRQPPPPEGATGLYRTMRAGVAKIPAMLEDYAFFTHGLIQLHRATQQPRWLEEAQQLTAFAQQVFTASDTRGGGYYDTLADQADLFVRTVSTYDGAVPSGNSQMAHNLLDLYQLTGQAQYLDQAINDLKALSGSLSRRGAAMVHMHHALLRALELAPDRFKLAQTQGQDADQTDTQPTRRQVVSASVAPNTIDLSAEPVTFKVTLTIGPEYHLNASDPGLIGVIPTTLELVGAPGYELAVDYPPGVTKRYPFADKPIDIYEGTVVLDATIRKTTADPSAGDGPATQPASPQLMLRYQVCTDMSCLEPKEVALPVTFNRSP